MLFPLPFATTPISTIISTTLLLLLILAITLFDSSTVQAAKSKRKNVETNNPLAANSDKPAEQLAPYIEKLDLLLALERPAGPRGTLLNQAGGKLAVLRQQFVTRKSKADRSAIAALDA